MLKERARTIVFAVFLLDLLLVALSFLVAHTLRHDVLPGSFPSTFTEHFYPLDVYLPLLPFALVIWAILLISSGRYRSQRTVPLMEEAWEIIRVTGIGSALFLLALFALRLDQRFLAEDRISRSWVVLFAVLSGLALVTEKLGLRMVARYARTRGLNYRRVVVVGTSEAAQKIADSLSERHHWGFRVMGLVTMRNGEVQEECRYPILGHFKDLPRLAEEEVVDDVIIAVGRRDLGRMENLLLSLHELGIRTLFALNLFPHSRPKVQLSEIDGIPLLTFSTAPSGVIQLVAKRVMDLILGTLLLIVALPIAAAIALGVKLTSTGAVLFRQTRCGLNGRRFILYKFRTMEADAESRKNELEHLNEMKGGPVFKIRKDPRITSFGRFLRKFSLDELPQLLNVIRGDMSLVGPRPPIPDEVDRYQRWQKRRLSMKPGLTGLWQVSGRNNVDFDAWMQLDLEYIDTWSPWLDLKILAKTVPVVLTGKGAS